MIGHPPRWRQRPYQVAQSAEPKFGCRGQGSSPPPSPAGQPSGWPVTCRLWWPMPPGQAGGRHAAARQDLGL